MRKCLIKVLKGNSCSVLGSEEKENYRYQDKKDGRLLLGKDSRKPQMAIPKQYSTHIPLATNGWCFTEYSTLLIRELSVPVRYRQAILLRQNTIDSFELTQGMSAFSCLHLDWFSGKSCVCMSLHTSAQKTNASGLVHFLFFSTVRENVKFSMSIKNKTKKKKKGLRVQH